MDFGMFTDFHVRKGMSQPEAFDESFNQVAEAERFGMDWVWLAEHHFRPQRSVLASPLIISSALAARTSKIRIGLAVQVLPLTNPLRVAEEAAVVDHISKGRFDFGIGRSGFTRYYEAYNIPYAESRGRFLEALDVITKAWSQDRFSHQGEYYTFQDVNLVPRPYQKPYPPIRVAANSEDTFMMSGSLGHSIFVGTTTPMPQLLERVAMYRQAWQEAGHPGAGDVLLRVPTFLAETEERARSEPEASTMHQIQYAAAELVGSSASPEVAERIQRAANLPYDEILEQRVMYGTPEAVVDRIHEFKEKLDMSGLVLEMNYGGQLPFDRVLNSMRLLSEKVMPRFK